MANQPQASIDRTADEIRRLLEQNPRICPVCQSVGQAMVQHVDHLFFERVTDVPTREALRASKGVCRRHARLVSRQADALGTALIMQDILINELRALESSDFDFRRRATGLLSFSARFRDAAGEDSTSVVTRVCPLCNVEIETEGLTVDSLLSAVRNADFLTILQASSGFCLPHFQLAHERARDAQGWDVLRELQRRVLTDLAAELGELARKSDYRFSSEAIGAEGDSWRRALDMTSGWVEG